MKKTIFILLSLLCLTSLRAQIIINEVMQSNFDYIMDDLNEFPDSWVELHNTDENPVSLYGYALGISSDRTEAYKLPNRTIPGKGFLIIYCDKEGRLLHANFRVDAASGKVVLFNNNTIVDEIKLSDMPAPNIAYGRKQDEAEDWCYMLEPTPGTSNNSGCASFVLSRPVFSHAGGVYKNGINLTLSLPFNAPPRCEIRYTTDGSEPTKNSLSANENTPIFINSSTVIKAKLMAPDAISIPATTHSYIFHERPVTLPVISITTNKDYLYDNLIGIYVSGNYDDEKKNYEYDWRRPINIEYFPETDRKAAFNQLAEMRVSGKTSRVHPLKSLTVYTNKRFGNKYFDYDIWNERPHTNIKSFTLRNSGTDFGHTYFRDAAVHSWFSKYADIDYQAYQPSILYINGAYMGIINIRERTNEDNVFSNYNGLEDIDLIDSWVILQQGDMNAFNELYSELNKNEVSYETFEKHIDVVEFMNIFILNTYFHNIDFPGNNCIMWRPRTADGRWRWIIKDVDFGWGLHFNEFNYLNYILRIDDENIKGVWGSNTERATLLFRKTIENQIFKDLFIDRFSIYMGDFLTAENGIKLVDSLAANIQTEMPYFRKKYEDYSGWHSWGANVGAMRVWIEKRNLNMYKYLQSTLALGELIPVTINPNETYSDDINITFNNIELSKPKFNGHYFHGKTIKLKGEPSNADKYIGGWRITTSLHGKTKVVTQEGARLQYDLSHPYDFIRFESIVLDKEEAFTIHPFVFVSHGYLQCHDLENAEIIITDLTGRIICHEHNKHGTFETKLPGRGIYIVTLIYNEERITKKVIY